MAKTYDSIRPGSRVTILRHNGLRLDRETGKFVQEFKPATGVAVMKGPAGWVLNMGGQYGTPDICTPENFVKS